MALNKFTANAAKRCPWLAFCFACLALSSVLAQPTSVTSQWKVQELILRSARIYDNPYAEVQVTGEFRGPDGSIVKTAGFWDGDRTFKIRFTAPQPGEWTYTVSSNQPQDEGLTGRGKIQVKKAPAVRHGFLRRDAENRYHFVYDDGTRYFMWGTTYYSIVLNALAGDKWKKALDSAMAYGINKIRIFANSTKNNKSPYPARHPFLMKNDQPDHDQLDPAYWRGLDAIVQYADQKGMVVDLMPFGYGAEIYGTTEQDEKYLRYVLARYAAYPNVIWCLVNEWNYIDRDHGKDKAYWNRLGRLVRDEDPWLKNGAYLRPLSIHQQTRIDFQFFDADWPVHAIVQYGVRNSQATRADEWDSNDPKRRVGTPFGDRWGNQSITYNLGHNMPVINDEYGYIGEPSDRSASNSKNKEDAPPFTREKHRQVSWGIVVAGGYGSTGDKNEYADGLPYNSANWHSDPPEYGDVKHLVDFFTKNNLDYWKMRSQNDLVKSGERVYVLAEPGKQYVFYAAAGDKFGAEIAPGSYEANLYDPRTGKYSDYGNSKGGSVSFTLPDTQDWVLYLKRK